MRRVIFSLVLIWPLLVLAQQSLTLPQVDSLTYQYYMAGDWDNLISVGKSAIKNDIDFKYLQQRLGYAYFLKGDFYEAMRYYENAKTFDKNDETTNLYLYYSGINLGEYAYARHFAAKLPEETRLYLKEKSFKVLSAVDFEYNHKWNSETNRSDPNYMRLGLNTQLGFGLNLYQAVSKYNQNTTYTDIYNEYRYDIRQDEYYALLSKSFGPNLGLDIGYHYLNTKIAYETWDMSLNEKTDFADSLRYKGNLYFGNLHYKWYRFNLGITASLFDTEFNDTKQFGIHLGAGLPGKHNIYIKNSVYFLSDDYYNWVVSSHSAGLLLLKKFWFEAKADFGNLTNFTDMNGMYIYNSIDPTLSRYGLSVFWYTNSHLNFFTNFTVDNKQNYDLLNNYTQNSLSLGIIWKL